MPMEADIADTRAGAKPVTVNGTTRIHFRRTKLVLNPGPRSAALIFADRHYWRLKWPNRSGDGFETAEWSGGEGLALEPWRWDRWVVALIH